MGEAITNEEITIRRVLAAPCEVVWRAWTEVDQLARWWGPPGWSSLPERITMDVRPGGAFRIVSVSDEDGTEMAVAGMYREVEAPRRLVLDEPAEGAWHEGAVSVVTFTDLGEGRTELVVETTIHTTEEMRGRAEAGMAATFDRLVEFVESR
jgi:uncharacterized protein YndB with AHSA1/START domain